MSVVEDGKPSLVTAPVVVLLPGMTMTGKGDMIWRREDHGRRGWWEGGKVTVGSYTEAQVECVMGMRWACDLARVRAAIFQNEELLR